MAYRPNRNGMNGASVGYDNQSMFMEQQNDALADDLATKVGHLKRVTIDIGNEVCFYGNLTLHNNVYGVVFKLSYLGPRT